MLQDPAFAARIDERFTGLRGYAALSVMLAHYQYMGLFNFVPFFKYGAQLSLYIFFFLSTFLLSRSLTADRHWREKPHLAIARYAINRVFRIFPLFLVVVTAAFLLQVAFFDPSTPYWRALLMSLSIGSAPSILWSIPVELAFYVYLPAILAAFLYLTRSRLGATLVSLAFVAWCAAIAISRYRGASPAAWMTLDIHHLANCFVGGVLFFALLYNGRFTFGRLGAIVSPLALVAFLGGYPFVSSARVGDYRMSALQDESAWRAHFDLVVPVAPLVVAGLVYGLLHSDRNLLAKAMRYKPLLKVGDLSFGIYLVHIPMLAWINRTYGYGQWQLEVAFVGTFVAAYVLSRLIEKPAIAFGHEIGRELNVVAAPQKSPAAAKPATSLGLAGSAE
jgi:peptidoglycan/LPS O-acetylase OafA/YrhL